MSISHRHVLSKSPVERVFRWRHDLACLVTACRLNSSQNNTLFTSSLSPRMMIEGHEISGAWRIGRCRAHYFPPLMRNGIMQASYRGAMSWALPADDRFREVDWNREMSHRPLLIIVGMKSCRLLNKCSILSHRRHDTRIIKWLLAMLRRKSRRAMQWAGKSTRMSMPLKPGLPINRSACRKCASVAVSQAPAGKDFAAWGKSRRWHFDVMASLYGCKSLALNPADIELRSFECRFIAGHTGD